MRTGSAGTKRAAFEALSSGAVSVVHLATHGTLATADKYELTKGELKMAGGQSLYAAEVQAMPLERMDLAVLSGCETGTGKQQNWDLMEAGNVTESEGVVGWYRAFLVAGARTVVASLWKVEDNSTRLLMERFYANMLTKMPKGAALREAMLWLRQQKGYSDPAFWAPFILVGDAFSPLRLGWYAILFSGCIHC
jgi:CHAT domain-containing protein